MKVASKLGRALLPLIGLIISLLLLKVNKNNFVVFIGTKAAQLEFDQLILPVRFVYLDKNQQIIKIWNNTKVNDRQYVLKFFNFENKEILPTNQELIDQYFSILEKTNPFDKGFIFYQDTTTRNSSLSNKGLKIELRESDLGLEEIYTYI